MKPEIDEAAGRVVAYLQLAGSKLDELREAAENADTVDELPGWARATLAAIQAQDEQPPSAVPDPGPDVDPAELADDDRLWTELAERQMIPPGSLHITPPPGE